MEEFSSEGLQIFIIMVKGRGLVAHWLKRTTTLNVEDGCSTKLQQRQWTLLLQAILLGEHSWRVHRNLTSASMASGSAEALFAASSALSESRSPASLPVSSLLHASRPVDGLTFSSICEGWFLAGKLCQEKPGSGYCRPLATSGREIQT